VVAECRDYSPCDSVSSFKERDSVTEDVRETGNNHRGEVEERHALLQLVSSIPARNQKYALTME
jgi:hypothetical protein